MTVTITGFQRSPDGGKGLVRDTRVRWALEEVDQPYEIRLVSFRAMFAALNTVEPPILEQYAGLNREFEIPLAKSRRGDCWRPPSRYPLR
jgi:hypothetical protein